MLYIYCLALENNKYYIGKTENPEVRLDSHAKGKGSKWTKLYKPIKVLELINNCDSYDEDKYVRIYMDKYGVDNVRGGSFSRIKLSQITIKELQKMSRGANDQCFKCGDNNHFSIDCKKDKSFSALSLDRDKGKNNNLNIINKKNKYKKYKKVINVNCYRCGRNGHYATKCKNKTTIDGYELL